MTIVTILLLFAMTANYYLPLLAGSDKLDWSSRRSCRRRQSRDCNSWYECRTDRSATQRTFQEQDSDGQNNPQRNTRENIGRWLQRISYQQ